jgi:hypothetical protein
MSKRWQEVRRRAYLRRKGCFRDEHEREIHYSEGRTVILYMQKRLYYYE